MPDFRPSSFGHVVYRTRRFEEMLRWYQTVFQAEIVYQNPALAFLTYDEEHHRFAFVNMSDFQPGGAETDKQGAIGVDHVGYGYASVSNLLENYGRLQDSGIRPYWCIHHGLTVAMYYADPDGNQVEFAVDCFPTKAETRAFMHTPVLAANPIGVEFNPDEWLERLRAGAPEAEFLNRPTHEPVSPIRGSLAAVLSGA